MTKTEKVLLTISIGVALTGIFVGAMSYFFGVEVVTSGDAHGFSIGDDRIKTYGKAKRLLEQSKIVAIHTWPDGEAHGPFKQHESPAQNNDKRWVMVVNPVWWNNTITLTYENNKVVKIRRDQIYFELP
jgi:hypothetical protein